MSEALKQDDNKLSEIDHWSERWEGQTIPEKDVAFDLNYIGFKEAHQILTSILEKDSSKTVLEIGSFPGSYMWYFNHVFGYQPYGVEYVEWCCEASRHYMKAKNIDATIYHADFFEFSDSDKIKEKYDVVSSFGFVEHFDDTADVVLRHARLTKKEGHVVIMIPNHSGFYGRLLKWISPEKHKIHNLMDYERLVQPVLDDDRLDLVYGGYIGHLGLWNVSLYSSLEKKSPLLRKIVRAPMWCLEQLAHYSVPNNKVTSPMACIVVKVKEDIN